MRLQLRTPTGEILGAVGAAFYPRYPLVEGAFLFVEHEASSPDPSFLD